MKEEDLNHVEDLIRHYETNEKFNFNKLIEVFKEIEKTHSCGGRKLLGTKWIVHYLTAIDNLNILNLTRGIFNIIKEFLEPSKYYEDSYYISEATADLIKSYGDILRLENSIIYKYIINNVFFNSDFLKSELKEYIIPTRQIEEWNKTYNIEL